jgi:pimeloyl-ACP methyl ester carboxylesterase
MDCFNRIGFSCIAYAPLLTSLGLALAAPFVRVTAAAASAAVDATDRTAAGSVYSSGGGSQGGVQLAGIASVVGKAALWLAGATLPRPDRAALMQQPRKFLRILPAALADSFCQGSRGVFADMRSTTLPWDLNLSSIKAPTVVFQGDADVNVTVNMAQWLQQQIPGAELRLLPDEAHFSLVANHSADMLSELLSKVHRTT